MASASGLLKRYLPTSLFWRAFLILVIPILVLQGVVASVFIRRHYDAVTVQMAGSVAQRAERLAKSVREISAGQVHLIGHSMGGLDARYAIRHLGLSQKVRSLTTIGTPHRGSPVANLGAAVAPLLGRIGVAAIGDLTTEAAEHFNRDNPDVPGVRYYSVVSAIEDPSIANSMLRPAYQVLKRVSGPNDGVVPASSQVWGEELERVPWDHWAQIGWSKAVDPVPLYLRLTTVLRRRGG